MEDQLRNEREWEACCKTPKYCCASCAWFVEETYGDYDGICEMDTDYSNGAYHFVHGHEWKEECWEK